MRAARRLILGAIVLGALAFRVWGITWGMHDVTISTRPHPDEWTVYWLFQWFGHDALNPCPNVRTSCFFDWGAAYLYLGYAARLLLSPVYAVVPHAPFGHADPIFIHNVLAGRLTSVLVSTLTVPVVYNLGRLTRGAAVGLIAAGLTASFALLIQLAHFATPDSTTVFLLSAALLALVWAADSPSIPRFAIAGMLSGFAAASEFHMVLLAIPFAVAYWLSGCRSVRTLLIAAGAAAAAWVITNPYALVEFPAFWQATLHTLRIRTVDSGAQYQGRFARYGPAWQYVVRYDLGYGVGAALAAWLVLGAAWACVSRRRAELILLAWVISYFVLITASPAKFMRYSAPLLPALAVLAAVFLVDLIAARRRALTIVAATAAAGSLLYGLAYDVAYAQLFTHPDTRVEAVSWLQHHAARGSYISFGELPDGLLNLAYYAGDAGYRPCISDFLAQRLRGQADYAAVDSYEWEEHPRIPNARVDAFLSRLPRAPGYRKVAEFETRPAVLGIQFPINNAPHDWRYMDHVIDLYRHLTPGRTGSECFSSVEAAVRVLYRGNA
ncbi:MAG TPA: glycosyltransferase family 39 protein [Chloroflexota bacterium]|nr:glycosyltransferase family 39 protein [Chloroflexota bacterium]